MRVSSVTAPSDTGTLKSTRTSTRFPAQSRSCTVRLAKLTAAFSRLGELEERVHDAVRETPLVVVPRQHLDHVALHDARGERVEDAARRVAHDVDRDDGV